MKLNQEYSFFLRKQKRKQKIILAIQILIFLVFLVAWEILANLDIIDSFLVSSPSRVVKTLVNLHKNHQLWENIFVTFCETVISFLIGSFLGIFFAIILWWFKSVEKIAKPYLVILNALPKVALGPIIIVWIGASVKSIIVMSLFISVIITLINISHSFNSVDKNKILLMKTFKASKFQIFSKIVLPINIKNIMSGLKINIGMALIGVITGEFLIAKKGIGYLIIYGGQVFQLDLVVSGIIILAILTLIFYLVIIKIEKIIYNYYTKK
ncbi:MAG: ABC transporter permease [Candidatus Improbicoccus devescovinae]|nr:MAG: ABC transporter permease [Candidatus Improbicoccus devescovinae]